MDAALKELAKLGKLTADGKAKSPPIDQTLDALLITLRDEREKVESGCAPSEAFERLATNVESLKKDLDERQKEIYNSISRYGKALDKVRLLMPSGRLATADFHRTEIPQPLTNFQPIIYFHQGIPGFGPDSRTPLSPNRTVHDR